MRERQLCRPDYKKLGQVLRESFKGVPIMALTATATPKVKQDLVHLLHMQRPLTFQVPPALPCLHYRRRGRDCCCYFASCMPRLGLHLPREPGIVRGNYIQLRHHIPSGADGT